MPAASMKASPLSRWAVLALALVACSAWTQDETVENPDYKAWAKQKAGAFAKWSVKTEGAMTTTSELTWTLKELKAEKALIEEKTVFTSGQVPEDVRTVTVAPRIRKGTLPEGDAVEVLKEGDAELTLKGRAYKCRWVEMAFTARKGSTIKIWRCDELVGGVARVEIKHDEASKMTLKMELIDWKAAS
jgi:hypothetical protein